MKGNNQFAYLILSLMLTAAAGCGNNAGGGAVSTLAASESCINCHANATSPGTGANIVAEWKASVHNTEAAANTTGFGSGCRNCHEPAPGHPNSCGKCHGGVTPGALPSQDVVLNPDQDGKCLNCHSQTAVVKPLGYPHFGVYTTVDLLGSNVSVANYVSSGMAGNCRACHNPHDNRVLQQTRDWAKSGHGGTTLTPWIHYDNKTRGKTGASPADSVATDCVRCHTATGYINYVSSGFTDIHAWGTASDNTKQVLYCNACHDDGNGRAYSFKRRKVGRVTGYYNFSSLATKKLLVSFQYPDLATSNICMACHTGREIGKTVQAVATAGGNFANLSFINSHYLTAGATIFQASGYEFAARSYEKTNILHDQIGRGNYNNTGNDGPCVTCHLKPARHTFLPVQKNYSGTRIVAIASPVCASCHYGGWTADTLETRKELFAAAMEAFKAQLAQKGYFFAERNPYFFTAPYDLAYTETGACSTNVSVKNWQTGGSFNIPGTWDPVKKTCSYTVNSVGTAGTGPDNMGAAFNYNQLEHDPGAFAHNSLYVRRLIYDSIDLLDDGVLNYSVKNTLFGAPHAGQLYQMGAIFYILNPNSNLLNPADDRP